MTWYIIKVTQLQQSLTLLLCKVCDTDHCLVVVTVTGRLLVSKQAMQKCYSERFKYKVQNIKQLCSYEKLSC